MCNYCEPIGWGRKCCDICGAGSTAYISISISVPHGGDFPYSTTDLCEKCWAEYGINVATDHNAQCREDLMPNAPLTGAPGTKEK